jgi:hypothetical protein
MLNIKNENFFRETLIYLLKHGLKRGSKDEKKKRERGKRRRS